MGTTHPRDSRGLARRSRPAAIIGAFLSVLTGAALSPCLAAARTEPPEPESKLQKTVEKVRARAESLRQTAEAWLREQEESIRGAIAAAEERAAANHEPGLYLPTPAGSTPGWTPLPAADAPGAPQLPDRLVLLVHGLDEPGFIWDELSPALAKAGYGFASIVYPNDQAIPRSTDLLLAALRDLKARGVERVDLVCHSMGGLVARDALTRAGGYAGRAGSHADLPDVPRLILVATPNAGSEVARLQPVGDLREQFVRWIGTEGHDPALLMGFLKDGGGDAGADLLPGSPFLADLNARPAPDGVSITCIVAIAGEDLRDSIRQTMETPRLRAAIGESGMRTLNETIEKLSQMLGDGCVTAASAQLPGVEDVVTVRANHQSVLRQFDLIKAAGLADPDATAPAVPVILDRLARPLPQSPPPPPASAPAP
ncbi:MAG: hypothetical protein KF745_12205 [Phycisphaeraceae bacterium]|nr:hypothetical protein [Phycisphaeraceae bacterium]